MQPCWFRLCIEGVHDNRKWKNVDSSFLLPDSWIVLALNVVDKLESRA